MTVIAYDPKSRSIACDSMFNNGSRKFMGKKYRWLSPTRVGIFAGDTVRGHDALDRIQQNLPLTKDIIDTCEVVVFDTKTGLCYEYDGVKEKPLRVKKIAAWGTGDELALGAMAAGAGPAYAVQVACTHNIECGGKIFVFRRSSEADTSRVGTRSIPVRQEPDSSSNEGQRREGPSA